MSITLGSITLPPGLRWSDEYAWTVDTVATEYSVTGALIVQRATKQAGRPVTLIGGPNFAWLTKSGLETLKSALTTYADSGLTLTLHDGRSFQVLPMPASSGGAIDVIALAVAGDSGPANPSDTSLYVLNSIKLIEI